MLSLFVLKLLQSSDKVANKPSRHTVHFVSNQMYLDSYVTALWLYMYVSS